MSSLRKKSGGVSECEWVATLGDQGEECLPLKQIKDKDKEAEEHTSHNHGGGGAHFCQPHLERKNNKKEKKEKKDEKNKKDAEMEQRGNYGRGRTQRKWEVFTGKNDVRSFNNYILRSSLFILFSPSSSFAMVAS